MQVEMSELEELESIYCDLHKDVWGVKARWYSAPNVEQAQKDIDALQAVGKEIWDQKKKEEAAAARFEIRVNEIIACGAKERATALRWIHDAEGTQGDNDYLAYTLGLPYKYFK
jgi:hypothetical protein